MKKFSIWVQACIILIATSCNGLNPSNPRILVVQQLDLGDQKSIIWFKDQKQITHDGISYFQIVDSICEVSISKANAICDLPIEIYEVKDDTISIMTQSEVKILAKSSYVIKQIRYDPVLFDRIKIPN